MERWNRTICALNDSSVCYFLNLDASCGAILPFSCRFAALVEFFVSFLCDAKSGKIEGKETLERPLMCLKCHFYSRARR